MSRFLIVTLALLNLCFINCAEKTADTPTAALNDYVAAANKRDLRAAEAHLSKGTIELIKKNAEFQRTTPDEVLNSMTEQIAGAVETRGEQITGDTATLEQKNLQTGTWDKIPFVREENRWKLALDKLMEETLRNAETNN